MSQNKLDDLSVLIKQYCPEIICITESWLTCDIPDIAVDLDGYKAPECLSLLK